MGITKPFVMLDSGNNVFTAEVDDLETFMEKLHSEGVTVAQVACLDVFEENSPADLLLPGEETLSLKLLKDGSQ